MSGHKQSTDSVSHVQMTNDVRSGHKLLSTDSVSHVQMTSDVRSQTAVGNTKTRGLAAYK